MIDTHTHIYENEFADDLTDTIARAEEAGVEKFVFPAIDSESYQRMVSTWEKLPGKAFCCMGLHPTSVNENWEREILFVQEKLREHCWIAVGEIGLDGHWSRDFMDKQVEVFREQMLLAYGMDLPVIIHVRDATEELYRVLDELKGMSKMPRGVFHAFSGSYETYQHLKSYGDFYFGIGGVVTYKNAQVATAVARMSLKDILLETDSPYLAPVPNRGKRNEPSYLVYISQKIADIQGTDVGMVRKVTTENAVRLFGFEKFI